MCVLCHRRERLRVFGSPKTFAARLLFIAYMCSCTAEETAATFLHIPLTLYLNLQENYTTVTKKKHVERNWFSDHMLLQIESIPAGCNELMAMYKHLAQNNNHSVSPQLTKLSFPDDTTLQIKAFSLHPVCPQFQVESMFCDELPELNVYYKCTLKIINDSHLLAVKCCNWIAGSQKANQA